VNVAPDRLSGWYTWCDLFAKLAANVARTQAVNINAPALRDEVKAVVRLYLNGARQYLMEAEFAQDLAKLDDSLQALYGLAEGKNRTASYKLQIAAVRKVLPKLTPKLEMRAATNNNHLPENPAEVQIARTLQTLIPTAGLSYQQSIRDLADENRLSYRGTASELREVLREVLDHLAPDEDVLSTEGFRLEPDRTKPTMKQKVRFILRARDEGSTATEMPERAAEAVDGIVGGLARSAYNAGSVVTHISGERRTVVQLKRYVEAVLSHLLEL
jgi:hypothetical protein